MKSVIQPQYQLLEDSIRIVWEPHCEMDFHNIWLRDNCRCAMCGDPAIGRRTLRTSSLALDVYALNVESNDDAMLVQWSDQHSSAYPFAWLQQHAYRDSDRISRAHEVVLWNPDFRDNPPIFEFDSLAEEYEFLQMLLTVRKHGFCFIQNAPAQSGTVERLALRIGPLQESNFGRVQDLVIDSSLRSIANSFEALKPHTDEPYRASPPGILMFHCIETDSKGAGASTFLDGFEAAEGLKREDPEGFDALCNNRQPFRRYFAGDVDLIADFPIISVDDFGVVQGVRINDRVAAPINVPSHQVSVYYRGLKRLLQLCEDEDRIIRRKLSPGDIAVFDNHRVLHGRTELTMNGRRWLQWIQVERGDFYSRIRILMDQLQLSSESRSYLRGSY